jgi:hypothetical protein
MYNKRINNVQLITFLKEKHYLDACQGEYDQQELDKITNYHISWTCIAFRVDLSDGDYSLVPETEEGGAEASLQYMEVLDTEGAQANLADEGKL